MARHNVLPNVAVPKATGFFRRGRKLPHSMIVLLHF
jgi:hypothetical protein